MRRSDLRQCLREVPFGSGCPTTGQVHPRHTVDLEETLGEVEGGADALLTRIVRRQDAFEVAASVK
jgi:hypothetical protein